MTSDKQKKVLAITVASPLTQNIYDRIGANVLAQDFDVVIFDCLEWIRRYDKEPVYDAVEGKHIRKIDSDSAFTEAFRQTNPSFVLDFTGRGAFTHRIQDACRQFGALYITHLLTPFPNPISRKTVWRSLASEPLATLRKLIRYVLRRVRQKQPLPPDIALLAGSESDNDWTGAAKTKIFTASPDYFALRQIQEDLSRGRGAMPGVPENDYILFIDDCLALSFDFVLGSYKPIVGADRYFPALRDFFRDIENFFMMPVVVAAHPNGKEFGDYTTLFGNRTVLFDATAALSVKCRFAMTHFSSAIGFPVLLRKQILLLNLKELKGRPQGLALDYLAQQLGCPQVEMQQSPDVNKLRHVRDTPVNEPRYRAYVEKYISNVATQDTNSFQSLVRHLNSLSMMEK